MWYNIISYVMGWDGMGWMCVDSIQSYNRSHQVLESSRVKHCLSWSRSVVSGQGGMKWNGVGWSGVEWDGVSGSACLFSLHANAVSDLTWLDSMICDHAWPTLTMSDLIWFYLAMFWYTGPCSIMVIYWTVPCRVWLGSFGSYHIISYHIWPTLTLTVPNHVYSVLSLSMWCHF